MMFEALKRGDHFPWDFQPLRDASEQYTRNHMSVTDRDLQSRFPKAPDIEGRNGVSNGRPVLAGDWSTCRPS